MWGILLYQAIIYGLAGVFVVSFVLFIRRLLRNSDAKDGNMAEIEKKLDRIIELLEKEHSQR